MYVVLINNKQVNGTHQLSD